MEATPTFGDAPAIDSTVLDAYATPRRLHPLTILQRIVRSLPAVLFISLPLLFGSADRGASINLSILMIYGIVMLPLIMLQYLRFRYWITPNEIVIHSGVLTRRKRSIPLDRIQNIEIERSLLPRLLGSAKVKIETAGSKGTEGVLEYVSLAEAKDVRRIVRIYQRQHKQRPQTRSDVASPKIESSAKSTSGSTERIHLFSMPLRQVLLSGAFRFSLVYLALIFSGIQYFMDALGMDPEEIAIWIDRGELKPYMEFVLSSPWLIGTAVAILAALSGWLAGILVNLSKYYNFELWLQNDKLQKRHGLLTVSEGSIPLKKVQSLILRSNPLMRRFGWYRLELQTMGFDVEKRGHHVAVPFAQKEDILKLAPFIRPFALPETFTSVSRITIRRRFIRYSMILLAVVLPLSYFWLWNLWGLVLMPFLLFFAVLQYRYHGYAFDGTVLFIKRGVVRQQIAVVPLDKIQVFYTTHSLFQRRLGLKTILIDTAGASSFTIPRVVDVKSDTADDFVNALYGSFIDHFDTIRDANRVLNSEESEASFPDADQHVPPEN